MFVSFPFWLIATSKWAAISKPTAISTKSATIPKSATFPESAKWPPWSSSKIIVGWTIPMHVPLLRSTFTKLRYWSSLSTTSTRIATSYQPSTSMCWTRHPHQSIVSNIIQSSTNLLWHDLFVDDFLTLKFRIIAVISPKEPEYWSRCHNMLKLPVHWIHNSVHNISIMSTEFAKQKSLTMAKAHDHTKHWKGATNQ